MNRGAIRQRVMSLLRIPPVGDPLLDEPTINDFIQAGLNDISSYSDWPWLLTSASLTFTAGSAPLPSTFVKARELVINNARAKPGELAEFLDQSMWATAFMWTIIGANIQLMPVPTVSPTNTLYFIRPEPVMTIDTASPLLPDAHQAALIARVRYYAEVRRAKADAAAFHSAEYETHLKRMADATKRVNRPRQIRQSGFERWATW